LQLLRRRLGIDPVAGADDRQERIAPMDSATASVPTASGSKYLQQLCKHWQHNLAVEFTPEHGTIVFPKDARGADHPGDGLVTFDAGAEALEVRIDATSPEQLEGLKGAVARHLDRFAFREAPLAFDWRAAS
jgi:hypothetical protein